MSNIKVAVRVRPPTERELETGGTVITGVQDDLRTGAANVLRVLDPRLDQPSEFPDSRDRYKAFGFDYVYNSMDRTSDQYASQELIFQELGTDVLQAAEDGYNACVFAYGQTGTGKTHTMMGDPDDLGLIPKICEGLFNRKYEMEEHSDELRFNITVSFFEIYNERVRDLLVPANLSQGQKYKLRVRENPNTGPFVEGLLHQKVKSHNHIQSCIDKGIKNRTTASTHMHERSSRSHAIFTIVSEQVKIDDYDPKLRKSKIHLVDLAGSERADPITKYDKTRQKEGANINKSLVTLGNVISTLADRSLYKWSHPELSSSVERLSASGRSTPTTPGGRSTPTSTPGGRSTPTTPGSTPGGTPSKQRRLYIPYRDSVLTWLLKDSLGGNSKTIMIATISPISLYYRETISTLRYAQRAKCIVNQPEINEDANLRTIRELNAEIVRLKSLLESRWDQNPSERDYSSKEIEVQAGSVMSLSESSSVLAERLEENETKVRDLTQKFLGSWKEPQDWLKDGDMSIQPLRLSGRSQSMGVIVDAVLPHLVGMSDDILQTGITLYYLKDGTTLIGRDDAPEEPDIVVDGPGIESEHCWIKNVDGEVTLTPQKGVTLRLNDKEVTGPEKLTQGDIIYLGTIKFRFNNPQEAAKLRERRRSLFSEGHSVAALSSISRCSSYSSINTSSGIDMESPSPTPNTSLFRGLEMERQYSTEREKIASARQDLERLQDEHRREDELRQDKEEEMLRLHARHRAALDADRLALARDREHQEEGQATAELELEQGWMQLEEERRRNEDRIREELRKIKDMEFTSPSSKRRSRELAVQTMPDLGELAVQTESHLAGAVANMTSSESQVGASLDSLLKAAAGPQKKEVISKRLTVEGQRKQLAQQELVVKHDLKRREQKLKAREKEIEEMYLATRERLEAELRRLHEREEAYRKEDAVTLEDVSQHTQLLEQIQHKERQLEMYIEEKERELEENPELLSSYSEEALSTPGSYSSTRSHAPSDSAYESSHTGGARPKTTSQRGKKTTSKAQDVTARLYKAPPSKRQAEGTASPKSGRPPKKQPSPPPRSTSAPSLTELSAQKDSKKFRNTAPRARIGSSSQADIPATIEESHEADKEREDFMEMEGDGAFEIVASPQRAKAAEGKTPKQSKKKDKKSTVKTTKSDKRSMKESPPTTTAAQLTEQQAPSKTFQTETTPEASGKKSKAAKKSKKEKGTPKSERKSKTKTSKHDRDSQGSQSNSQTASRDTLCSSVGEATLSLPDDDVRMRSASEPVDPSKLEVDDAETRLSLSGPQGSSRPSSASSEVLSDQVRSKKGKPGIKRTHSKSKQSPRSSESFLSKSKKSKQGEDFHVEFYVSGSSSLNLGGGSGGGMGGPSAEEDIFRQNTEPTHEYFARSLRASSAGSEKSTSSTSGSMMEEQIVLENGTKIIRRQRMGPTPQEIQEELRKQNRTEQFVIPRKLQDGRTQSFDDNDGQQDNLTCSVNPSNLALSDDSLDFIDQDSRHGSAAIDYSQATAQELVSEYQKQLEAMDEGGFTDDSLDGAGPHGQETLSHEADVHVTGSPPQTGSTDKVTNSMEGPSGKSNPALSIIGAEDGTSLNPTAPVTLHPGTDLRISPERNQLNESKSTEQKEPSTPEGLSSLTPKSLRRIKKMKKKSRKQELQTESDVALSDDSTVMGPSKESRPASGSRRKLRKNLAVTRHSSEEYQSSQESESTSGGNSSSSDVECRIRGTASSEMLDPMAQTIHASSERIPQLTIVLAGATSTQTTVSAMSSEVLDKSIGSSSPVNMETETLPDEDDVPSVPAHIDSVMEVDQVDHSGQQSQNTSSSTGPGSRLQQTPVESWQSSLSPSISSSQQTDISSAAESSSSSTNQQTSSSFESSTASPSEAHDHATYHTSDSSPTVQDTDQHVEMELDDTTKNIDIVQNQSIDCSKQSTSTSLNSEIGANVITESTGHCFPSLTGVAFDIDKITSSIPDTITSNPMDISSATSKENPNHGVNLLEDKVQISLIMQQDETTGTSSGQENARKDSTSPDTDMSQATEIRTDVDRFVQEQPLQSHEVDGSPVAENGKKNKLDSPESLNQGVGQMDTSDGYVIDETTPKVNEDTHYSQEMTSTSQDKHETIHQLSDCKEKMPFTDNQDVTSQDESRVSVSKDENVDVQLPQDTVLSSPQNAVEGDYASLADSETASADKTYESRSHDAQGSSATETASTTEKMEESTESEETTDSSSDELTIDSFSDNLVRNTIGEASLIAVDSFNGSITNVRTEDMKPGVGLSIKTETTNEYDHDGDIDMEGSKIKDKVLQETSHSDNAQIGTEVTGENVSNLPHQEPSSANEDFAASEEAGILENKTNDKGEVLDNVKSDVDQAKILSQQTMLEDHQKHGADDSTNGDKSVNIQETSSIEESSVTKSQEENTDEKELVLNETEITAGSSEMLQEGPKHGKEGEKSSNDIQDIDCNTEEELVTETSQNAHLTLTDSIDQEHQAAASKIDHHGTDSNVVDQNRSSGDITNPNEISKINTSPDANNEDTSFLETGNESAIVSEMKVTAPNDPALDENKAEVLADANNLSCDDVRSSSLEDSKRTQMLSESNETDHQEETMLTESHTPPADTQVSGSTEVLVSDLALDDFMLPEADVMSEDASGVESGVESATSVELSGQMDVDVDFTKSVGDSADNSTMELDPDATIRASSDLASGREWDSNQQFTSHQGINNNGQTLTKEDVKAETISHKDSFDALDGVPFKFDDPGVPENVPTTKDGLVDQDLSKNDSSGFDDGPDAGVRRGQKINTSPLHKAKELKNAMDKIQTQQSTFKESHYGQQLEDDLRAAQPEMKSLAIDSSIDGTLSNESKVSNESNSTNVDMAGWGELKGQQLDEKTLNAPKLLLSDSEDLKKKSSIDSIKTEPTIAQTTEAVREKKSSPKSKRSKTPVSIPLTDVAGLEDCTLTVEIEEPQKRSRKSSGNASVGSSPKHEKKRRTSTETINVKVKYGTSSDGDLEIVDIKSKVSRHRREHDEKEKELDSAAKLSPEDRNILVGTADEADRISNLLVETVIGKKIASPSFTSDVNLLADDIQKVDTSIFTDDAKSMTRDLGDILSQEAVDKTPKDQMDTLSPAQLPADRPSEFVLQTFKAKDGTIHQIPIKRRKQILSGATESESPVSSPTGTNRDSGCYSLAGRDSSSNYAGTTEPSDLEDDMLALSDSLSRSWLLSETKKIPEEDKDECLDNLKDDKELSVDTKDAEILAERSGKPVNPYDFTKSDDTTDQNVAENEISPPVDQVGSKDNESTISEPMKSDGLLANAQWQMEQSELEQISSTSAFDESSPKETDNNTLSTNTGKILISQESEKASVLPTDKKTSLSQEQITSLLSIEGVSYGQSARYSTTSNVPSEIDPHLDRVTDKAAESVSERDTVSDENDVSSVVYSDDWESSPSSTTDSEERTTSDDVSSPQHGKADQRTTAPHEGNSNLSKEEMRALLSIEGVSYGQSNRYSTTAEADPERDIEEDNTPGSQNITDVTMTQEAATTADSTEVKNINTSDSYECEITLMSDREIMDPDNLTIQDTADMNITRTHIEGKDTQQDLKLGNTETMSEKDHPPRQTDGEISTETEISVEITDISGETSSASDMQVEVVGHYDDSSKHYDNTGAEYGDIMNGEKVTGDHHDVKGIGSSEVNLIKNAQDKYTSQQGNNNTLQSVVARECLISGASVNDRADQYPHNDIPSQDSQVTQPLAVQHGHSAISDPAAHGTENQLHSDSLSISQDHSTVTIHENIPDQSKSTPGLENVDTQQTVSAGDLGLLRGHAGLSPGDQQRLVVGNTANQHDLLEPTTSLSDQSGGEVSTGSVVEQGTVDGQSEQQEWLGQVYTEDNAWNELVNTRLADNESTTTTVVNNVSEDGTSDQLITNSGDINTHKGEDADKVPQEAAISGDQTSSGHLTTVAEGNLENRADATISSTVSGSITTSCTLDKSTNNTIDDRSDSGPEKSSNSAENVSYEYTPLSVNQSPVDSRLSIQEPVRNNPEGSLSPNIVDSDPGKSADTNTAESLGPGDRLVLQEAVSYQDEHLIGLSSSVDDSNNKEVLPTRGQSEVTQGQAEVTQHHPYVQENTDNRSDVTFSDTEANQETAAMETESLATGAKRQHTVYDDVSGSTTGTSGSTKHAKLDGTQNDPTSPEAGYPSLDEGYSTLPYHPVTSRQNTRSPESGSSVDPPKRSPDVSLAEAASEETLSMLAAYQAAVSKGQSSSGGQTNTGHLDTNTDGNQSVSQGGAASSGSSGQTGQSEDKDVVEEFPGIEVTATIDGDEDEEMSKEHDKQHDVTPPNTPTADVDGPGFQNGVGNLLSQVAAAAGETLTKSPLHLRPVHPDDKFDGDKSGSTTDDSEDKDAGEYKLVHYKKPEPRQRKKSPKRSSKNKRSTAEKISDLQPSEMVELSGFDEMETILKDQGLDYVTLTGTAEAAVREHLAKHAEQASSDDHTVSRQQEAIIVEAGESAARVVHAAGPSKPIISAETTVTHSTLDKQDRFQESSLPPSESPYINKEGQRPDTTTPIDSGLSTDYTTDLTPSVSTDADEAFSPFRNQSPTQKSDTKETAGNYQVVPGSNTTKDHDLPTNTQLRMESGQSLQAKLTERDGTLVYHMDRPGNDMHKSDVSARMEPESTIKSLNDMMGDMPSTAEGDDQALELRSPTDPKKARLVDTQTFVLDIHPGDTRKVPAQEPDQQEVVFGSHSTLGFAQDQCATEQDYQVFGLQPPGTTKFNYHPGPARVLRDSLEMPGLEHMAVNIEIRPRGDQGMDAIEYSDEDETLQITDRELENDSSNVNDTENYNHHEDIEANNEWIPTERENVMENSNFSIERNNNVSERNNNIFEQRSSQLQTSNAERSGPHSDSSPDLKLDLSIIDKSESGYAGKLASETISSHYEAHRVEGQYLSEEEYLSDTSERNLVITAESTNLSSGMNSAASTDDDMDSEMRIQEILHEKIAIAGSYTVSSSDDSFNEDQWRSRAYDKMFYNTQNVSASEAKILNELVCMDQLDMEDMKADWLLRAAASARSRKLRRQLSPGEIVIDEDILNETEPLSMSCERFAELCEEVSHMDEYISHDVGAIRAKYFRRRPDLQRSLSTSELYYVELPDRNRHLLRNSADNIYNMETLGRVQSSDSFTYVFLSHARSLDQMTMRDREEVGDRQGTMTRPKSIPLYHKDNDHLDADMPILPINERSASMDLLPVVKSPTRHKSSSLDFSGDNAHLFDIPPEMIFGGAVNENDILRESFNAVRWSNDRDATREVQTQTTPPRNHEAKNKSVSFGNVMVLDTSELSGDSEMRSSGSEPNMSDIHGRMRSPRSPRGLFDAPGAQGKEIGIQTSTSIENIKKQDEEPKSAVSQTDVSTQASRQSRVLIQQALRTVRQSLDESETDESMSPSPMPTYADHSHAPPLPLAIPELPRPRYLDDETSTSDGPYSSSPELYDANLLASIRKATQILEAAARLGLRRKGRKGKYLKDSDSDESDTDVRKRKSKSTKDEATFISLDIATQTGSSITDLSQPHTYYRDVSFTRSGESSILQDHLLNQDQACAAELNINDSFTSQRSGSDRLNLTSSSQDQRTIETQTYPNSRVIETQTNTNQRIIETQTKALDMNRSFGSGSDGQLNTSMDIGIDAPHRPLLVDTGVGASPPWASSPAPLSPRERSAQATPMNVAHLDEDLNRVASDDELMFDLDDMTIQVGTSDGKTLSLNDSDLDELKQEHKKLMETFRKAKENRDESIKIQHQKDGVLPEGSTHESSNLPEHQHQLPEQLAVDISPSAGIIGSTPMSDMLTAEKLISTQESSNLSEHLHQLPEQLAVDISPSYEIMASTPMSDRLTPIQHENDDLLQNSRLIDRVRSANDQQLVDVTSKRPDEINQASSGLPDEEMSEVNDKELDRKSLRSSTESSQVINHLNRTETVLRPDDVPSSSSQNIIDFSEDNLNENEAESTHPILSQAEIESDRMELSVEEGHMEMIINSTPQDLLIPVAESSLIMEDVVLIQEPDQNVGQHPVIEDDILLEDGEDKKKDIVLSNAINDINFVLNDEQRDATAPIEIAQRTFSIDDLTEQDRLYGSSVDSQEFNAVMNEEISDVSDDDGEYEHLSSIHSNSNSEVFSTIPAQISLVNETGIKRPGDFCQMDAPYEKIENLLHGSIVDVEKINDDDISSESVTLNINQSSGSKVDLDNSQELDDGQYLETRRFSSDKKIDADTSGSDHTSTGTEITVIDMRKRQQEVSSANDNNAEPMILSDNKVDGNQDLAPTEPSLSIHVTNVAPVTGSSSIMRDSPKFTEELSSAFENVTDQTQQAKAEPAIDMEPIDDVIETPFTSYGNINGSYIANESTTDDTQRKDQSSLSLVNGSFTDESSQSFSAELADSPVPNARVQTLSQSSLVSDRSPSRTAGTQYERERSSDSLRTTSTQYDEPFDNVPEYIRNARDLLKSPEVLHQPLSTSSPRSTGAENRSQDSEIQTIVEKYQSIKRLIEDGDDSRSGTPISQYSSSRSNLRDIGTEVHVCVTDSSMETDMDRPGSAPITSQSQDSEVFSPPSTRDESMNTDFKDSEYDDELERLRRERQRILDMMARDNMPSKLQVELAEAQLNYLIGQTDTLLHTIDDHWDANWDMEKLMRLSAPEEQLSNISKEYLAKYRATLEKSRLQIEHRITTLEQAKVKHNRSMDFVQMRREAQVEAFRIERQREQMQHQARTPRSKSASPDRSRESITSVVDSSYLKPHQRTLYLSKKRQNLIQSTHRPRSLSPAMSSTMTSPITAKPYSTGGFTLAPSPQISVPTRYNRDQTELQEILGRYDFVTTADTASIDSSLDEDTARLLTEYQSTRGDTQTEIRRARESLDKKPATRTHPQSVTLSTTSVYAQQLSGFSTPDLDLDPERQRKIDQTKKKSQKPQKKKVDQNYEIDREIEELKRRYRSAASISSPSTGGASGSLSGGTSSRFGSRYSNLGSPSLGRREPPRPRSPPRPLSPPLYDPTSSTFTEADLYRMTDPGRRRYGLGGMSRGGYPPASDAYTGDSPSVYSLERTRPVRASDLKARSTSVYHSEHLKR